MFHAKNLLASTTPKDIHQMYSVQVHLTYAIILRQTSIQRPTKKERKEKRT